MGAQEWGAGLLTGLNPPASLSSSYTPASQSHGISLIPNAESLISSVIGQIVLVIQVDRLLETCQTYKIQAIQQTSAYGMRYNLN